MTKTIVFVLSLKKEKKKRVDNVFFTSHSFSIILSIQGYFSYIEEEERGKNPQLIKSYSWLIESVN
jgi:hypothetical protein